MNFLEYFILYYTISPKLYRIPKLDISEQAKGLATPVGGYKTANQFHVNGVNCRNGLPMPY